MKVQTRNFTLKEVYPNNDHTPDYVLQDHRGDHRERKVYFDDVKFAGKMGYSRNAVRFHRVISAPPQNETEWCEEKEIYETKRDEVNIAEPSRWSEIFVVEEPELDAVIVEELKHIEEHGSMREPDKIVQNA